jgi:ribosome-binding factor A
MSVRQEKVASRIRQIIAADFLGLRDPRLHLITITEVKVTGDFSHARVFYTLHNDESRKETEKALHGAQGHFRSLIGREMKLRQTPEVHFIFDETEARASRIEAILDGLKKPEPEAAEVVPTEGEPV